MFERFAEIAQTAATRLRVRSALNPMLWLCAIATPLCFAAAYLFRDVAPLRDSLVIAGFVPIGVTCLGFIGFALFRPEKLQSEDYQLRHESLQIIQQKAGRLRIPVTSIEAIANPKVLRLTSSEE